MYRLFVCWGESENNLIHQICVEPNWKRFGLRCWTSFRFDGCIENESEQGV